MAVDGFSLSQIGTSAHVPSMVAYKQNPITITGAVLIQALLVSEAI